MHYLILTSIAILLWSSLAVLVSSLSHIPPFLLLAVTLFIGGSLSVVHYRRWNCSATLLTIGVFGIFGYHFLLFMALRMAPPVSANLLNYLWPIFILLFTPLIFPDIAIQKRHLFGTLIAFSGAGLILMQSQISLAVEHSLGYLLALLASITWAFYSLLSKKVATFSSATVGLFCLISSFLGFIAHVLLEQTPDINASDAWKMVLLGIGPMGISFYCWDAAVKKGDPRIIATLSYFTPLFSTLLLIIFADQQFTKITLYSLLLIVSGALVASVRLRNFTKRR